MTVRMALPNEEPCWNVSPFSGNRCDMAKGHPGASPHYCHAFWNGGSFCGWDNRVSITIGGKPADPKVVASIIEGRSS